MTLLDYPGKVACTVFLGACDFRCPFCHNWELIDGSTPAQMDSDKLMDFLKKRQGILEGVAITGGEPMLHKDLPELLTRIRELGFLTKVDTNGNHPDVLAEVLDNKLADYIAMDVKNCRELYTKTAGLDVLDLGNIDASIAMIMEKAPDYEFRTTVVEQLHSEESFEGIGSWIKGAGNYYLQKFTDRDTVPFAGLTAPDDEKMHKYLDIARKFVPSAQLRGVE